MKRLNGLAAGIGSVLVLLAAALALTFGASSARADLFDLNVDHSSGSAVTVSPPLGTVTLTQISTGLSSEITIVYQADTSQIFGFHEVGFNYSGSSALTFTETQVGSTSPNTFPSLGSTQMDGLGTFTNAFGQNNAGPVPAEEATTVTVDIKGADLTLAQFENPSSGGTPSTDFAVGMAYLTNINKGRTGFVGATPVSFGSDTPEPTQVVALLGLAGMGFVGFSWRRRKQVA
jgi:PEP-CTERM motif